MEYLRCFLLWFLGGLGAALGVAIVAYAFAKYTDTEQRIDRERWLPSASVEVTDVEPIAMTKDLTVAAVITNKAGENVIVELELALSQGAKVLFTCTRTPSRLPGPGKSERIQISCSDVEKQNIPSGVSYAVKVRHVRPLR